MSQLAELSGELQALVRRAEDLDRRLIALQVGEVARLRRDYLARARGPQAHEARRALAALDVVERELSTGRTAIARVKVGSLEWLAQWGASRRTNQSPGSAENGWPGARTGTDSRPGTVQTGAGTGRPERLRKLAQHADTHRAGPGAQAALDRLEAAIDDANRTDENARHFLVHAWQGQRHGARNAYAPELRKPEPSSTYVVIGADSHVFLFETDRLGRTRKASSTLEFLEQPRARPLQATGRSAKEGDADDDGGHLIGHMFGGPGEEINIVPQDWFENRTGTWHRLEKQWQALLQSGQEVWVDVEPVYSDESGRPDALNVIWARRASPTTGWVKVRQTIPNDHRHGSKRHESST